MKPHPLFFFLSALLIDFGCAAVDRSAVPDAVKYRVEPIIVDHTCTDLDAIPDHWVQEARARFGVAYGFSVYGSQLVEGLENLDLTDARYEIDRLGAGDALAFFTNELEGDLGTPDRHRWEDRTRFLLTQGWGDVNVVVWSWGDELTRYTEEEVDLYLRQMSRLEKEFPQVAFVYMTAPLDGTGAAGNVHQRNEQIRAYCRQHNKILYDFADIERFDPDGNDYLNRGGDFGSYYRDNGVVKNWAEEWCDANPGACVPYDCPVSKPLNCDLKARAFWWMLARLAGWQPEADM